MPRNDGIGRARSDHDAFDIRGHSLFLSENRIEADSSIVFYVFVDRLHDRFHDETASF